MAKITTQPRSFEGVVEDLRHAVFAVIRFRPDPTNSDRMRGGPLGSGFFISRQVFLTCNHVLNNPIGPHQDGDHYVLVNNLGHGGSIWQLPDLKVGKDLFFFPDCDLSLIVCPHQKDPSFVALDEREATYGSEIGVAGYPLPRMAPDEQGKPRYDGLIYRVAKGTITSTFETVLRPDSGPPTALLPVIEVNFLFVPGNSGGPVFDARTGRVKGFVHGYQCHRIKEQIAEASQISTLPDGLGPKYIESVNAIYSLAVQLRSARAHLAGVGVSF
ncbi:MAG: trypsin-like peptidase domain-containing protein [Acidobacteria bacterium]|nr:trypsin-like peptidase domain-containing protein [Acidobacteriota bacterium]